MTVSYEWSREETDVYGDIHDSDFSERLKDLSGSGVLVLVRSEGDDNEGVSDRRWAYVKDGMLPECFDGSQLSVPKRFHKELARCH